MPTPSPNPSAPLTAAASNEAWVAALRGPERDAALDVLREVLVRGLRAALAQRPVRGAEAFVEDFAQDALVKILDRLDTFRGESRFTTWAQKVAVRVALTELRRKRWQDVALDDLAPDASGDYTPAVLASEDVGPDRQTAHQLLLSQVEQTIEEALTERQQAALAVVMEGVPLDVAAERLGTNRNALYKLIFDARKRLRKALEQRGVDPETLLRELAA